MKEKWNFKNKAVKTSEIKKKSFGLLIVSLLGFSAAGCSAPVQQAQENASDASAGNKTVMACDAESDCGQESENDEKIQTVFEDISFDDAIRFLEEGKSGYLYFYFPDCAWCQDVTPVLEKEAEEQNQTIYRIRTRDDQKNRLYSDEQKEQIIPYLGSVMSENEEGELTLYVPLFVKIEEGQVAGSHVGTVDGHDAKEREMTTEEKEQMEKEILEVFYS